MFWRRRNTPVDPDPDFQFLTTLPVFSDVSGNNNRLKKFYTEITLKTVRRHQLVYSEGEKADRFYIVRDGEIHIIQGMDIHHPERFIAVHGRGSIFGEASFFSHGMHATNAVAALDSRIFEIPGTAFLHYLNSEPGAGLALINLLSSRLTSNLRSHVDYPARIFIFTYPDNVERGQLISSMLTHSLSRNHPDPVLMVAFTTNHSDETNIVCTDCTALLEKWPDIPSGMIQHIKAPNERGYDLLKMRIPEMEGMDRFMHDVPALLGVLRKHYSLILVNIAGTTHKEYLSPFYTQSDRWIVVHPTRDTIKGGNDRLFNETMEVIQKKTSDWINRLITTSDEEGQPNLTSGDVQNTNLLLSESMRIYRTHIRLKSSPGHFEDFEKDEQFLKSLDRLSRRLTGKSRGIALGGGGARAMAHIGVLDILDAEKIEFDAIAASSMGSLVGALYASGLSPDQILYMAKKYIPNSNAVLDKTIPLVSFFKGKKIAGLLNEVFQDIRFEDLEIPFYCNGADLNTGKSIVFQKGSLARALQASISIPGTFPPYEMDDYSIVDGSVLNMVPGDILRKRGFNHIIGVNVSPFIDHMSSETSIRADRGMIRGLADYISLPPILKIISRSFSIQSNELLRSKLSDFDYVFHPTVDQFDMYDFHKIDAIVEEGRRSAISSMNEFRQSVRNI